ncbi:MAG: DUF4350 domain-containing protein [Gemmatimonadaceae bacterium]|nr:DUF4350 domain-containing protein [Gemmatimonadaceae bacterium]
MSAIVWTKVRVMIAVFAVLAGVGAASTLQAQQVPDKDFKPPVPRPAFAEGKGPRLCLDEAHHNFHTLDNRFWAFGELARRDGYRVAPSRSAISAASLGACDLFVISNAQWSAIEWDQYPTPTPSAFTSAEISALKAWVENGGRLLLIADHMPLAGAAMELAAAFGATFTDGFAYPVVPAGATDARTAQTRNAPTLFEPTNGTLAAHPITRGRDSTERITRVRSFTGQAFRVTGTATAPVMVLPQGYESLEPRYAWTFDATTKRRDVSGWLQGATRRVGRGRVAFFGEAAMFSAQVTGPQKRPMGMNAELAEQNPQFALNTLHWLSGVIDPE